MSTAVVYRQFFPEFVCVNVIRYLTNNAPFHAQLSIEPVNVAPLKAQGLANSQSKADAEQSNGLKRLPKL